MADVFGGDGWDLELEFDPNHEWRMEQLEAAGFTHFQAFRLSVNGADWHDAKRMLDSGCDPDQVVEILI